MNVDTNIAAGFLYLNNQRATASPTPIAMAPMTRSADGRSRDRGKPSMFRRTDARRNKIEMRVRIIAAAAIELANFFIRYFGSRWEIIDFAPAKSTIIIDAGVRLKRNGQDDETEGSHGQESLS